MSGSGWKTLPAVREWWEALPDVRELSGVSPGSLGGQLGGLGMVGTPSRMSLRGGRPLWMSGSCRVALPDTHEWSGGLPICPGVVGRPCQMSGSCRKDPAGCLGVVWRPF